MRSHTKGQFLMRQAASVAVEERFYIVKQINKQVLWLPIQLLVLHHSLAFLQVTEEMICFTDEY